MRVLIALLALFVASCATTDATLGSTTYSVPQLISVFDELDGQVVRVRGWANGCDAEYATCGLFENERRAKKGVIDGWAHVVMRIPGFSMPEHGQVLLMARVIVTCRNGNGTICLERTGHLEPISLRLERP